MASNAFFKVVEIRTGKVIAVQDYYIDEANADTVLDKINDTKSKGCYVLKIEKTEWLNWKELWGI